MKYLLFFSILIFCKVQAQAQAHLGMSENEIKNSHKQNSWKTDYTNTGVKYLQSEFTLGTFVYYINKDSKVSDLCLQIPFNNLAMNAQIEAYNKKYVITSDISWTAYLDEGGIMYIKLKYDTEKKISYFVYSDSN